MCTYSVHHKTRLELKHVMAVGDLVEAAAAAIYLHLNRCTLLDLFAVYSSSLRTNDNRRKPLKSAKTNCSQLSLEEQYLRVFRRRSIVRMPTQAFI